VLNVSSDLFLQEGALKCLPQQTSTLVRHHRGGKPLLFVGNLTESVWPSYIYLELIYQGRIRRLRVKCDVTRAETRFRLSAKRTSPFKSAGASVYSTTGRRGVRISVSNAGYTMFRGSVKSIGYPLHSPFSPSLPLPRVTVCHHISTGLYNLFIPIVFFPPWW